MRIINIVLTVLVLVLFYFLYETINAPIKFNELRTERYDVIEKKLEDIKNAQIAYKDKYGKFAENFNELTKFVKQDTVITIRVIGNPDDTNQVIRRDTLYEPAALAIYGREYPADSLAYIPFTNGKKFDISAGEIKTNNVKVKVFEVSTSNEVIFSDVKYKTDYDPGARFALGSMSEARFGIKRPLE